MTTGLERWANALGNQPIWDADKAEILASPNLQDALRQSVRGALTLYDSDAVLHRNVKDAGRFLLGVVALYLDATGGLTHRRLRTLMGDTGIVSAGRATAILWQLQRIGYVVSQSERVRGRSHLYLPTDEMRRAFLARFRVEAEAFALIDPAALAGLAQFGDEGFSRPFLAELGKQGKNAAGEPHEPVLPLLNIAERTAGMLILFALIEAADDSGSYPPVGPIEFSIAKLAARFEVSRTHVRRLIKTFEAAGYFTPGDKDGTGRLTPRLGAHLHEFYAINYMGVGACMHAGLLANQSQDSTAAA